MGFGAEIQSRNERNIGETLKMVQPEDLLKFGLIPEFVGRLPVIATLHELNEQALVRILTEPKNALVKQFKKLMEFENVALRFTDSALHAVAKKSLERKSGARGLRAIMEESMLEIMYDIPSMTGVKECVINEDVILDQEAPILLYEQSKERALS
jgi:ATP-dependent Clp protease ATP-binding subunit ClpX